jgi:hypothetical protein
MSCKYLVQIFASLEAYLLYFFGYFMEPILSYFLRTQSFS